MKKKFLLIISLLIMLLFTGMIIKKQFHQTVAGSMISSRQLEMLVSDLEVTEDLNMRILCNQKMIPYDKERGIFYLPQVSSKQWMRELKFSVLEDKGDIYWIEDPYWEDMEKAITEEHIFEFVIADQETLKKGKLVFTGLPMLNLEKLETIEENNFYCKVTVFDPFHNYNERYELTQCYGYFSLRGRTSTNFPKKGWNLELINKDGTQFKMEMLGLREDDDWKLNALYTDATKVKEMVCMELWNEIAETTEEPYDAGFHMEYFELVVDDEYQGLYGMMEQIDYKQLSLDKNEDVLYKGCSWPEVGQIIDDFSNRGDYCGQMIKPGNQAITLDTWIPMIEYIDATNFNYNRGSVDEERLYEYILNHINLENMMDIELYIQALYAADNLYKNLYIAADRKDNGEYTLWKVPWDLNYTFGEDFCSDEHDRTIYNYEWSEKIMSDFMITEIILNSGNQEFAKELNQKWLELRNGILSVENVKKIAEEYRMQLEASGVLCRDSEKWIKSPQTDSLNEMMEFHENRLRFLDEHYNSYLNKFS